MDNKVQETIKWWYLFNQKNIIINSKSLNFKVKINDNSLLHLIGIQYINKNIKRVKGKDLLDYIKNNNFSDTQIYEMIQKNNPNQLENVKQRVNNFKYFMENLENGYVVEMTNKNTKIKSNYLIVQLQDDKIMQLGIKDIGYEDVFETFIIEKDDLYFKDTTLKEPIISIQKYNDNGDLEEFSFKQTNYETDIEIKNLQDITSIFCDIVQEDNEMYEEFDLQR